MAGMKRVRAASSPKYMRILEELKREIETGGLKSGDRLPPERELSERFQVARPTLRAALDELESLKLIVRTQGSGTYVAEVQSKAPSVCLVYFSSDPQNLFLQPILQGISDALSFSNASINLLNVADKENLKRIDEIAAGTRTCPWSGLIYYSCYPEDKEILNFRRSGVQIVGLAPPHGKENFTFVDADNYGGAYTAVRHLLACGRKKVLHIDCDLKVWHSAERRRGVLDAMKHAGIEPDPALLMNFSDYAKEFGPMIESALERGLRFDSALVQSGSPTLNFFRILSTRGISVPDDVAMIMYDDYSHVHGQLPVSITAVKLPFYEVGTTATKLLLEQIRDPSRPIETRLIPPMLIIRDSCGAKLRGT